MRLVLSGFFWGIAAVFLTSAFVFALPETLPDVTLCGQYENVTDPSNTYSRTLRLSTCVQSTNSVSTVSTNVWGRDASGASCVDVGENATTLSTTWSWLANETLVHAYPNINYNPIQRNPIRMSNLSSIDVKVSWSMKPEMSTSDSTFDTDGLAAVNAKTNVAFDVFFDTKLEKAVNTTAPSYEVMVWIGMFGSILPIGAKNIGDESKLPKQKIGKETL
jgi:xyloglucan-specific endo-beta-1,4-glucanase